MKYRSLEDWNKKGKRVKKGERHSARTSEGVPLFSNNQVVSLSLYEEKGYFDRFSSKQNRSQFSTDHDYDYDNWVDWDNFGDWGSR